MHAKRATYAWLGLLLALLSTPTQAIDPAREATLHHLLVQDCGSCHGLRMTGGLGPSLTPEALAGKPRESLIATVAYGRAGTAMPGWQALLDEQDIAWLVDRLLQGGFNP